MSRQKFLHHYLPAHLASALVCGAVLNFVLVEAVDYPVSVPGIKTRLRPATRANVPLVGYGVLGGLLCVVVGCWIWIGPLTYGLSLVLLFSFCGERGGIGVYHAMERIRQWQ